MEISLHVYEAQFLNLYADIKEITYNTDVILIDEMQLPKRLLKTICLTYAFSLELPYTINAYVDVPRKT